MISAKKIEIINNIAAYKSIVENKKQKLNPLLTIEAVASNDILDFVLYLTQVLLGNASIKQILYSVLTDTLSSFFDSFKTIYRKQYQSKINDVSVSSLSLQSKKIAIPISCIDVLSVLRYRFDRTKSTSALFIAIRSAIDTGTIVEYDDNFTIQYDEGTNSIIFTVINNQTGAYMSDVLYDSFIGNINEDAGEMLDKLYDYLFNFVQKSFDELLEIEKYKRMIDSVISLDDENDADAIQKYLKNADVSNFAVSEIFNTAYQAQQQSNSDILSSECFGISQNIDVSAIDFAFGIDVSSIQYSEFEEILRSVNRGDAGGKNQNDSYHKSIVRAFVYVIFEKTFLSPEFLVSTQISNRLSMEEGSQFSSDDVLCSFDSVLRKYADVFKCLRDEILDIIYEKFYDVLKDEIEKLVRDVLPIFAAEYVKKTAIIFGSLRP